MASLICLILSPPEPLGSEPYLSGITLLSSSYLSHKLEMPESHPDKKIIRTRLLQQRKNFSLFERQTASKLITQRILTLNIFQTAKTIALYQAFQGEVDLEQVWIIACQQGKKVGFPVISSNKNDKTMHFMEALPDDNMALNHFQIKEPSAQSILETFDCLFIPLVAFDEQGYRLGMGQGYYDRALAALKNKPLCIGVAYDFQKITMLPHDPWDIPLDMVITETHTHYF